MYIDRRATLATKAVRRTNEMQNRFSSQIAEAVANTREYTNFSYKPDERFESSEVTVEELDTVAAALTFAKPDEKLALLNFASYKHPGGGFISGALAQEEALCHESFLYNVLREFDDSYYEWNRNNLNYGMYTDRALYSPDIYFGHTGRSCLADVITCACPNASVSVRRYGTVSEEQNRQYCTSRIKMVLSIAAEQKVDTLILGAYGCGVFKQNPDEIATTFATSLAGDFRNVFERVVFAIPGGKNYEAFARVFKS